MGQSARSLSKGHPCEKPKLHIQLAGLDHPSGQSFQIYQAGTDNRLTEVEATLEQRPLEDSVIYSWECKPYRNYDIALGVDTDSGPLRLPLFQRLRASELNPIEQTQHNLVVPVIPLAFLPCYREAEVDKAIGACRNGYLYLFYQGKAWREIQVTSGDNGYEFKDIDLNAFRDSDGFAESHRSASGKTLEEIWLPALTRQGTGGASELLVAFSEVQWSAAYLGRLEQHDNECRQRCGSARSVRQWHPQHQTYGIQKDFKPLRDITPLRERDLVREYQLGDPWRYACDIEGTYLSSLAETAKSERASLEKQGTSTEFGESAFENGTLGSDHLARDWALQQLTQSVQEQDDKENKSEEKEDHPAKALLTQKLSESDFLAELRPRKLYALVLDDTLFALRHLFYQIQGHHTYLQSLLLHIEQHKDSKSAMLIQRLIMPDTMAGKENPLVRARHAISTDKTGHFMRVIREAERQHIHLCIDKLQAHLLKALQRHSVQADLKDLAALDGPDSGSLHVLMGQLLSSLVLAHQKADHLHHTTETHPQQAGLDYVERLLDPGAYHPLHACLFPQPETDASAPANNGSGQLTARRMAQWLPGKQLPAISDLQTQELQTTLETLEQIPDEQLAMVFEKDNIEVDAFPNIRRGIHFMDGILESISGVALAHFSRIAFESSEKLNFTKIRMVGSALESLSHAIEQQLYPKLSVPGQTKPLLLAAMSVNGVFTGNFSSSQADALQKQTGKRTTGTVRDENGNKIGSTRNKSRIKKGKNVNLVELYLTEENAELAAHRKNMKAGKIAANLKLPIFMMVAEICNLSSEIDKRSDVRNTRSEARSDIGIGSAIIDLSVMMGKFYIYFNQRHAFLTEEVKTFTRLASAVDADGKWMVRSIGRIGVAGLLAGGLTSVIALADAFNALQRQDKDAALAHGAIALGTLVGTFGSLVAKGGVLLGLGPVGWLVAGFGLAIAGAIALWFWESSDLELMLEKGVFGINAIKTSADDELKWLITDPEAAYAQLLDELVNLRIRIQPMAEADIDKLPQEHRQQLLREKADTCITLEYNLPPLSDQSMGLSVHVREGEKSTSSVPGFPTITRIKNIAPVNAEPLLQYHDDGRLQLFFRTARAPVPLPVSTSRAYQDPRSGSRTQKHYWLVRAQLSFKFTDSKKAEKSPYVWPRPPLSEADRYPPEEYRYQPSFKAPMEPTPFWANERQHGITTHNTRSHARQTR